MVKRIALIVGCARSGTSIVGELLAAHPDVHYIWEAHLIWSRGGSGVNDSQRLTAAHATEAVSRDIRQWFEEHSEPGKLTVEKDPRNSLRIPYVRAIFPEARIVHAVRDGRDVACSMVPGCGGREWRHLRPPSWRDFYSRYDGVVRCAHVWKEVMEIVLADLAVVPHLQIHYEELVRQPRSVAKRLLAYLGLANSNEVMRFCNKVQDVTASSYHAQRQVRWYREDHRVRIGRWRENLDDEQKQIINDLLFPLLVRLGYAACSGDGRES